MSEIKLLQQVDYEESLQLAEFAFQRSLSPEDKAVRLAAMPGEQIWGWMEEGRLAAQLSVLPLQFWIGGQIWDMGGIAFVSTWPEYRRKGMIGRLLDASLATMREQGIAWSALAPFSYAFYRKYGWEAGIDYIRYEVPSERLPRPAAAEGSRIRQVPQDSVVVRELYLRYARQFNGMLARSEDWWATRVFGKKHGIVSVYWSPSGGAEGYIFYQVKETVLTVHEMICLSEEARRGIWRYLSQHDSMISRVVWHAPIDDPWTYLLEEPRVVQEIVPYFMVRIVDVERVFGEYAFAEATDREEKAFYLQIEDSHATWNSGLYRLSPQLKARERVSRLSGEEVLPADAAVLTCDIQTLSALFIGYKTASQLHVAGKLIGEAAEADRLERHIPAATPFLADYF
ncbi:GNAT family N-acetyltransferase [Paenibacillus daejeonensis]|uniref:GNAT family N-acetyltransferase n=1 Tax=Paenibacillus daejeonensis TaxID=135193 RepID=UPI00035F49CB|nr:GNAT family N-acetyltransferase [Paenibacillus daejeonensis]